MDTNITEFIYKDHKKDQTLSVSQLEHRQRTRAIIKMAKSFRDNNNIAVKNNTNNLVENILLKRCIDKLIVLIDNTMLNKDQMDLYKESEAHIYYDLILNDLAEIDFDLDRIRKAS